MTRKRDAAAVFEVGDADDAAERQRPVRCDHLALVENLAAGGFLAVKPRPVPRGQAKLERSASASDAVDGPSAASTTDRGE